MKNKPFLHIADKILCVAQLIGLLVLIIGTSSFVFVNYNLFSNSLAIIITFTLVLLVGVTGLFIKKQNVSRVINIISGILSLTGFILMILVIVFGLVIDLFQPLALSTVSIILLIVGVSFSTVSTFLKSFIGNKRLFSLTLSLSVVLLIIAGATWAKTQNYQKFYNIKNEPVYIFQDGEGGYSTFRIPSLISIDSDTVNKQLNTNYENDLLFASAEGRKNSSKDIGEIDMVYKISTDNGNTWSDLKVLLHVEGEVGKVGNPTPVFDVNTGFLNMLYLKATAQSGYDYRTYNVQCRIKEDLTFDLGEPILLNKDIDEDVKKGAADGVNDNTIMVGPGKSLLLDNGDIIVPCSNQGYSFVMYSEDGGATWKKGENAATGNECEVAQLNNGELIMVTRENLNVCNPHNEQYQRFSYSKDNGRTWYKTGEDSILKSPVCMTSVSTKSDGTLLVTYPDDFRTRTDLSIAYSMDNGKTFNVKKLYDGPGAYSCVTVNSKDETFVIAEIGKVNYNEAIVFLQVD